MWASFFIVWRESIEALLVIGILYAWIKREQITGGTTKLWIGTVLGLIFATILALIIYYAGKWYADAGGQWFLTIMMAVASFLILHMVIWMKNNGRNMRLSLEQQAKSSTGTFSLITLVAIAVAREGSETVVFLTGIISQSSSTSLFIFGAVLGFFVAIITFIFLQIFSHVMPCQWFFNISAIILLLLGGALLVGASDKAVNQIGGVDNLPEWVFSVMYDPIWSTEWLISDSKGTLAGLTGYNANPTLSQIIPLALYWAVAIILFNLSKVKRLFMKE